MYMNLENSRKRKRGEKIFEFHTFGDPGCPADYDGPFRDNVRVFLDECAEREPYNVDGMPAWSINLQEHAHRVEVPVYVVEESIYNSPNPHCDNCRCIGWSHHLVSNRRYHFIIPAPEIGDRPLGMAAGLVAAKVCPNCHDRIPSNEFDCLTCGQKAVQGSVLDVQSHLLHGMIHCNGFGHLLCVNGREKGSKYVSGREIMDLWDRICNMLRARKVSVEDVAKKRSMEFRLLNCVAYGESWYGRWGYRFGHGSFGVTQQMYTKAIEAIRGIPLTVMMQHFEGIDPDVLAVVSMYQRISGQTMQTIGDLIRFMLELKARLPLHPPSNSNNNNSSSKSSSTKPWKELHDKKAGALNPNPITADTPCRWSVKRLDLATQVIVEALKNCERRRMSRQDVRDAARVYIGDTGLLDFVLKSLGNRIVGGYVVRRAVNPVTKVLEYSLDDVNTVTSCIDSREINRGGGMFDPPHFEVGRAEVMRDIVHLYKHVLENYKPARRGVLKNSTTHSNNNVLTAIPTASRIILDTKQFIKDYKGEMTRKGANNEWAFDDDEMLRVMCSVLMVDKDIMNRSPPPPEMVVLPPHATIGDLKKEAQRALRDTYIIMHSFKVESIPDLDGDDDDLLFGAIESGSNVLLQGSGMDMSSDLRYEGGSDNWTVDCPCGTKDDDGERMIACDMCEVWQHTRCGGISDMDSIPQLFLCNRCGVGLFQAML